MKTYLQLNFPEKVILYYNVIVVIAPPLFIYLNVILLFLTLYQGTLHTLELLSIYEIVQTLLWELWKTLTRSNTEPSLPRKGLRSVLSSLEDTIDWVKSQDLIYQLLLLVEASENIVLPCINTLIIW